MSSLTGEIVKPIELACRQDYVRLICFLKMGCNLFGFARPPFFPSKLSIEKETLLF
jgi:hypothetical protein